MGRIAHVDINSYFATILQQENPKLRGKPVGVVKDAGRTCVIAASKEAKHLGVKTGCSKGLALRLAPDIEFVPTCFDVYLNMTRRLKQVFLDVAPTVDIFSLDEAFIDISDCQQLYPDAETFGRVVQERIKAELGEWVTCNVGVSDTRLLAKLASEVSPAGSITEITPENQDVYLAEAPFSDVCGVGWRLERKLAGLGITNLYQLNFFSIDQLKPYVGEYWAQALLRMARGEDSPTLERIDDSRGQAMKSVGRTITGRKLCDDETLIKKTLYNLTAEAAYKIRSMDMAGRYVAVHLWGHGTSWGAHKTLPYFIRHTPEIFSWIYDQLYRSWERHFPVIKYGVFIGNLQPMSAVPISLLPSWQQQEKVSTAVDALNQRYGLFTVRPATLTKGKLIRPEVTGYLGDKQFYGL